MALGWRGQYLRYREFFLNISALYKKRADLRAFLEVILSITTVVIFLLFALKPTALTIISLLQEIKEKQATVAGLTQKVQDLNKANNVFAENQSFIPDIEKSVATGPAPDAIVQQVEGIAAKDSTTILGISVGQVTLVGTAPVKKSSTDLKPLPEGAVEMPISISVRGEFPSLLAFIKDVENLRIAIKIDSIGITASETDAGQIIVAVVAGRVPYLNQ